jgi:hypothetical protein
MFLTGDLLPTHVYMGVTKDVMPVIGLLDANNLEQGVTGKGKAHQKVGQVVGGMIEMPVLDDVTMVDLTAFPTVSHIILWRSERQPDDIAFTTIDSKGRESRSVTYRKLSMKIHSLSHYLVVKKGIRPREHAIVMFPHGLDYVVAIHACLYAGIVPIPFAPPDTNRLKEDIPALLTLVNDFEVQAIICNSTVEELLKGKPVQSMLKAVYKHQKAKMTSEEIPLPSPSSLASSASSIASFSSMSSTSSAKSSSSSLKNSSRSRTLDLLPPLVLLGKAPKLKTPMHIDDRLFYFAGAQFGRPSPLSPDPSTPHQMITLSTPIAIVHVTYSADFTRTVVQCGHTTLLEQCRLQSIQGRMLNSVSSVLENIKGPGRNVAEASTESFIGRPPAHRPLVSCIRSYNGLALLYSVFLGVYVGANTIMISPFDFALNPQVDVV